MAQKNCNAKNDVLDKKSSDRLEKLGGEWIPETSNLFFSPERLTASDLKLLLEHFAPLQQLIRALVATPTETAPTALVDKTDALRTETSDTEDRLSDAEDKSRTAQDALAQTQTELAEANRKHSALLAQTQTELAETHRNYSALLAQAQAELAGAKDRCSALQHDLDQCNDSAKTLYQQKEQHQQASKQLQKDLQTAEKDLKASQAELARAGSAPPELALLRQDTALAQALSLSPLPSSDTEALVQTVAVLAQRDNLERLWGVLKERCEAEHRPASAPEQALLSAALAWYNHNWRTRPYRLIEAAPAAAYDFNAHLRSRHTNTGETITAQLLPGIADGSGNPLCKALVSTR